MVDMKRLGENIRQMRKIKGLTQEELAKKSSLSTMSIRRYESGKRTITEKALDRIASALDVGIYEFFPKGEEIDIEGFPRSILHPPTIVSMSDPIRSIPDKTGKTETFQPWTLIDENLFQLGGFDALFAFEFLSEADRVEALKDINKFVEFTLSKYKQQGDTETALESAPEDKGTTQAELPPESAESGE